VCEKCILLNRMCLFAILQQSMHFGRNVTNSLVKKILYMSSAKQNSNICNMEKF
jgi:hypothetical protein